MARGMGEEHYSQIIQMVNGGSGVPGSLSLLFGDGLFLRFCCDFCKGLGFYSMCVFLTTLEIV